MVTLLRRFALPLAALSLLFSLSACVVYPIGGYGRPHAYYGGGGYYGGGYYGHGGGYGRGGGYYH